MPEHLVAQLLVTSLVVFLFAGSLLGLALGLGLLLHARGTLPFIRMMNRWVSLPPGRLDEPRRVAPAAASARGFGVLLMLLGAYTAAVLLRSLDVAAVAAALHFDPRYSLPAIGLLAGKWMLVAGALAATAIGVLLAFFPRTWRRIEALANRWYSTRELEARGNVPYFTLDRAVEAFPRAAGLAIFLLSLVTAAASATLVFR